MPLMFPCEACGKPVKARSDWVGKATTCLSCGRKVIVPPPPAPPAPAPPAPPPPDPYAGFSPYERAVVKRLDQIAFDTNLARDRAGWLIAIFVLLLLAALAILAAIPHTMDVTIRPHY